MVDTASVEPRELKNRLAIRVRDLHVRFKVYEEQRLGIRELIGRKFRSRQSIEVHAVRGISLDIKVGEAVGVIGANGSGKSTTLRAIAGLEPIAFGQVLVRHQPHLLGVGAALQANLSGRRNIILGGLAVGLALDEIQENIDHVIAFAGLAEAIDRPLRTYSSGMRARLAFSIATLKTPDILLIDEALAVGDRSFRTRSLERIRNIQDQAGTIVMVTHNLAEIRATCERAIWIDEGRLVADGPSDTVIGEYTSGM